ncbi:MAG: hypothetical protein ACRCX2_10725 [Paraclostridium sp.]
MLNELVNKQRELSRRLSKAKTDAKKRGADYTVCGIYNSVMQDIKKVKKEIMALEIQRMKNHELKTLKFNNNGRHQY